MSVAEKAASQTSIEFIQVSCNTTTYPNLCITSLSTYASNIQTSPKLLAQTALSITLDTINLTSTLMSELSQTHGMTPKEVAGMLDCTEVLSDSVDALRESLKEMSDPGEKNFGVMMNDVQTWVSAALTDEDTCTDGFAGDGKMKKVVRGRIVNVAHLTSNALALINSYASLSG